MNKWGHVLAVGCVGLALLLVLPGCAKKQVDSMGQDSLAVEQGAGVSQNGAAGETDQDQAGQMTAEEMEEFRLQEKERQQQEAQEAAAQEKEKAKAQATQNLQERIHFAFDAYELRVQARQILKEKAEILDKFPEIELVIEGHCDERGTDEYNLALGERRARAAYEFLVLLGIDPERLSIISYGEERPLVEGHNESAWAKNRRCEFRVVQ